MSLEKAKAAIAAAQLLPLEERDPKGLRPIQTEEQFSDLLRIASVHASIAQAESLAAIADLLARVIDGCGRIGVNTHNQVGTPW